MDADRFSLGPRERALRERAEAIAVAHPRPVGRPFHADELRAIFRELAPTGYLGSTLPPEAGGHGLSGLEFACLVEGLSPGLTLLGNHSVQRYLHQFGSAAQQARYLPDLLAGEGIGAIAMTETEAGSDLERMGTRAQRVGDRYVLDGEKTWVTHGLSATLFVVLARTDAGLTRFLVPGNAPGLEREALSPLGLTHIGFARVVFRGCELPVEARLGEEGAGLAGAKAAFPIARLLAALQGVRIARAALAMARDYAGDRVVARAPLASSTLVQHGVARLWARCEAAHLLCMRVATQLGAADAVPMASAAKAMAGELALEACRWAEDLLGSSSLHQSHPLVALAGDARMMAVVDGTSVLNHFVVGRRQWRDAGSVS
ncbi:MAG: acyl-CoA/acyl-ACP dehydrogenase [Hydrogenophaga sp.]|nr:acyl-CoA/acyl-ACP dehydrogenase [Hydrogenophaga sp.]